MNVLKANPAESTGTGLICGKLASGGFEAVSSCDCACTVGAMKNTSSTAAHRTRA
jgi:hypothetical protein